MNPLWILLAALVGFGAAVALFKRQRNMQRAFADSLAPWAVGLPALGGAAGAAMWFLARLSTPPNAFLARSAAALWALGVVGGLCLGVVFWHRRWGKFGVLIGAGVILWFAYRAFRETFVGV